VRDPERVSVIDRGKSSHLTDRSVSVAVCPLCRAKKRMDGEDVFGCKKKIQFADAPVGASPAQRLPAAATAYPRRAAVSRRGKLATIER